MIEKMKKLTFLVTDSEYDAFIEGLCQQGVVHIQQLQQGATSDELQQAMALDARFRAAILVLDSAEKTYAEQFQGRDVNALCDIEAPETLLSRVEALQVEETKTMHAIARAEKQIAELEPWGEFDAESLHRLEGDSSMQVHFFRCSSKFFLKEWVDQYFAIPINEINKQTYFVTFSAERPDITAEHLHLPEGALSQYEQQLQQQRQHLDDIHAELLGIHARRSVMEAGRVEAENAIALSRVHLDHERVAGDVLRLMVGWTLADKAKALTQWLDAQHIYYEMEDPSFEDDVPIQLTNNSYSRLFEPILRMYSLPSYSDLDPTVFFAPFFMLFFGLCLGDGGYGVLVLLGGIFLALKGKGDMRSYGRLGIWLGLMTVICGLATGTVFGIDLSQQPWAFLAPVKPYFLNDNGVGPIFGYSPMMVISVIIGLVQVLLGMILKGCKALKNYGWPYAVGTFSWVVALLSAIALYGLPMCGVALPMVVQYILLGVIGVSAIGIFLYNNPASYKRPVLGLLSNIGGGVWATYGMATGLLGDLLSYIRLFALGLTGGVLGGVFNSLAYDMTDGLPWYIRWLPMVIVLLAGHGITFALSMISAFVHPMRLTFVEFFKNADFGGGGKAYNPFRRLSVKN